jgi:hypothetical protein
MWEKAGCKELPVRTVSGMVAEELEEPISAVLKNRRLRRGESDNPTSMILSVLSQVYITLNHEEQSNLYLFSREVFIHKMFRVIRFFYWTTCQILRVCRLFPSWDWGVLPTTVVESVFNTLGIVASWFSLRKGCEVNPQLALDRGATSISCGLWGWEIFSTIIAKPVLNWLDIMGSLLVRADHGAETYSPRSLPSWSSTDLTSWGRGTSFMVTVSYQVSL